MKKSHRFGDELHVAIFTLQNVKRHPPQEWKFTNFIFASAVKLPLKVFQNSFRTNNPNCPFSLRSSDFDDENLKTFFQASKVFRSALVHSRHRLWDICLFISNSSVVVLSKNVSTSPICGHRAQHKKTGSIVELNYSIYGEQFVEFSIFSFPFLLLLLFIHSMLTQSQKNIE